MIKPLKIHPSAVKYYVARIIQRVSLLSVIAATIYHWIWLVIVTSQGILLQGLNNVTLADPPYYNKLVTDIINKTSFAVLRMSIFAFVLTIILFLAPRVRKHEKRLIVDSLIIIVFCLISTALSQIFMKAFYITVARSN